MSGSTSTKGELSSWLPVLTIRLIKVLRMPLKAGNPGDRAGI
jgi:hypothetical protein